MFGNNRARQNDGRDGMDKTMHILLTNDDGISSPGLAAIYGRLTSLGRVTVVAPSGIRSAAGHSISLEPVVCQKLDMGSFEGYSVDGTPADCVKLALNQLVGEDGAPVDLVVSGINHGANLGVHVFYSGTVAAAMEGAFHGLPAVALSAAFEEDMDMHAVAGYCIETMRKLLPLAGGNVISINIPKLSAGKPKGVKVVPHAASGFREGYSAKKDADGTVVYTFDNGSPQEHPQVHPQSHDMDTAYLPRGYVTVTALKIDLNDHERNRGIEQLFQ